MIDITTEEGMKSLEGIAGIMTKQLEKAGGEAGAPSLPDSGLDMVYSMAHAAYSVENYAEAEALFTGMIIFNDKDSRGWLGYAGASEAQKKWGQAIEGYGGLFSLKPDEPVAPYRAGVCFMALEDSESARSAFETAAAMRDVVQNDPSLLLYVKRAESMIHLLDAKRGQA